MNKAKKVFTILLTLIMCLYCMSGCTIAKRSKSADTIIPDTSEKTPDWVIDLAERNNASQIFIVAGVQMSTAYVSMHQKDESGNWSTIITTPGFIGKHGLGKTKEGDGMTPIGTFHFNKAFGIANNPGCSLNYQKVTNDDWWSGDENYNYNKMVNINDFPELNKDNSEHIIDYTYEYQYALNISYNEECEPGKGSAIFLHCFGAYKPQTGGCVAIPKQKMEVVMKNVKSDCVVIIDYLQNLSPETYDKWAI